MAPLLRRSWSPRGGTPILRQRTRSHQKVSILAALCLSPRLRRIRLFFRLHPHTNVTRHEVVAFLRQLQRHLRGRKVLLWDRFGPHQATCTRHFLRQDPSWYPHFFPPYAPELNPVENVWSYLKLNPLANAAIPDLDALNRTTHRHARNLARAQSLLRAFAEHTPLSLHPG